MGLIVPSIDLLKGKAVRLRQGKVETAEVLGEPLSLAAKYAEAGFEWLHIVDLDAAFGGRRQAGLISMIAGKCTGLKLQVGGGIRSCNAAEDAIASGAERVVFGTALFEATDEVRKAAAKLGPEKAWVGLDFSGKQPVARVRGWVKKTGIGLDGAFAIAAESGAGGAVVSSVDADGMQQGPDVSLVEKARRIYDGKIWLAGGMRSAADAKKAFGTGADGAIFGRALYDKKTDLRELACLQKE